MVSRSATSISHMGFKAKPWSLENPERPEDKPSLWLMPSIKELLTKEGVEQAGFDQCMFGLETTKPTIIAYEKMSLANLAGVRCDHPLRTFRSPTGREYQQRMSRQCNGGK